MHRAGLVEGMFLSSGVIGTHRTMDEMLATTELVREKYGFRGYIHLKLLPNAEPAHVERAVELADRVSVNLEGPTEERLNTLAPKKNMAELLAPLRRAAELRRKFRALDAETAAGAECTAGGEWASRAEWASCGRPFENDSRGVLRTPWSRTPLSGSPAPWGRARLGLSTQFVVGPAGESDQELLTVVDGLYRELRLSRTYYSAFTPVKRTPLEDRPATHPTREHRLYQADWLLRFYGFRAAELAFAEDGQLRTDIDPKAAWARAHPERFPVEVNHAPLSVLLRVPGIGPLSARAIIQARTAAPLHEIGDLRRLGARADQAAPFVLLNGKRPPYQPPLPALR
jgi:predicted DNA-binding helix-hairpin-helix protein